MKIKHYFEKYYLILCGLVFYIILKIFRINNFSNESIGCINLLGQGNIYSGEIGCAQGPVFYFFGLIFKKISGVFFSEVFLIFAVLVSVLILYFMLRILKKKINYFLLLFLYLAFICFLFLDPPNYYPSTLLSALFVFSAVYFMFYSKLKYKFFIGGILFGLAIFTKMNGLVVVGLVCLYYLIKKRSIKDLIKIVVPILVIAGMFKLIFPNLFLYVFGTQFKLQGFSFVNKIIHANFGAYYSQFIFVLLFLVLSFISLWKFRDLFSFVSFFGFFVILISAINTHGWLDFIEILQYRYFLPIMPFFVIMLIKFKNKIVSRKLLYFIFILCLVILIYIPFKFTVVPSMITVNSIGDKMLDALELVPVQEDDKILAYEDLTKYNKNFKGKLDVYPDPDRLEDNIDPEKLKTYIPAGITNLSEKWKDIDRLSERTTPYYGRVLHNTYDIIILGIAHGENKLFSLLTYIFEQELSNNEIIKIILNYKTLTNRTDFDVDFDYIIKNNHLVNYSKLVYIPILQHKSRSSRQESLLAFKNLKDGKEFEAKIIDYYIKNYDYFCDNGGPVSNRITITLMKNNADYKELFEECESDFLFFERDWNFMYKFSLKDLIVCLILMFFYIKIEKRRVF